MDVTHDGRSPIRDRQLNDLRLPPRADDPRPLFIDNTYALPRDVPVTHLPYPKLLWHKDTGKEITVKSLEEHQAKGPEWVTTAPGSTPQSEADRIKALFDALSPEDQQMVLEQDRKARLDKIQAGLSSLSESDRALLLGMKKAKKN